MIRPHRLTDGLVVVAVVILVRKEVAMTAANRGGSRGLGYRPPNVWSASTIFSELIWSARQTDAHAAYPYKRCGLQPADPFRLVIPDWRYWDLWPTATILSDVCRINWLNWIKKKNIRTLIPVWGVAVERVWSGRLLSDELLPSRLLQLRYLLYELATGQILRLF